MAAPQNFRSAFNGFNRQDVVHYLDDTLDRQYPISAQLTRLYEYFCYELSRVKSGRNKTELERVKRMACELRESFRTAEKNATER